MSGSTIPAALDGLVAAFTNYKPTGLQVVDGPVWDATSRYLAVGWDRSDQPAVQATAAQGDYAGNADLEQYAISCLLSYHLGDDTLAAVRSALFADFHALRQALAADRRLGGAVMTSRIGSYEMTPTVDETGERVDLRFTVEVEAWSSP